MEKKISPLFHIRNFTGNLLSPNQHYEYNKAQTGDTEIDNQAQ